MEQELLGIEHNIKKANETDGKVQNLASYINATTLKAAHRDMNGRKASGVDKVTKDDYDEDLDANLESLVERIKSGSYRPKPSRRVYIPKDGKGKMRSLGISSYEDKLVESVVAQILGKIYEPKFLDFSYVFRKDRSCHQAVRKVVDAVQHHKTNYVVEVDIRGFFDHADYEWLMKFLKNDTAGRRILDIVQKFLDAGIMEKGKYLDSEMGVPQGNGASPVLANVFLHYALDLWFDVKKRCRGECYLIRYADDFVCCFQYRDEAESFLRGVKARLRKFGLEVAEEKTRILEFGRFACKNRKKRGGGKPVTFDFLGFTFYCGMDRTRRLFRCKVKTSKKKYRSKVRAMKEWIKTHRMAPLEWIFDRINAKLRGHYQYYGVTDNIRELRNFLWCTEAQLFKWLNRRSQRESYTWETFNHGLLLVFPLLQPSIRVSLFKWRVK